MKTLRAILFILRRGLLMVLIVYWFGFIGFTLEKLAVGGPRALIGFYVHISGQVFNWKWPSFLLDQLVILTITLAVYFIDRRASKPADTSGTLQANRDKRGTTADERDTF
jgi:hypothetical protein